MQSVFAQTYRNIEYIIIDGNSTDTTCEIIAKYKNLISHFVSELDSGIYSAWNKGITMATGDYVLILNSDDALHDERVVEDVVNHIDIQKWPAAIYGKVLAYEKESGYSYIDGRPTKLTDFLRKMNYCTPAAFVKKETYDTIGLYNEHYSISSDYDWAIRLFKHYPDSQIAFYDRIVTDFCLGGTSNRYYRKAYREVALIIRNQFSTNSYIQHLVYNRLLLFKMSIVAVLRNTFFLKLWRHVKQHSLHKDTKHSDAKEERQ
jgi:glycosyltransferase involved in cell wall biosynthesis